MRLLWTHDLHIGTMEARDHWAMMEGLLEVMKFLFPHYENTVMICKWSPAQVNPSRLDTCHEICPHVSVHPSEGVTSHDLSIFDIGHDCYS